MDGLSAATFAFAVLGFVLGSAGLGVGGNALGVGGNALGVGGNALARTKKLIKTLKEKGILDQDYKEE